MYNTRVSRRHIPMNGGFIMDPFFQNFFGEGSKKPADRLFRRTTPAVNVSEDDAQFEIQMAAPGLTKADFKIEMDNYKLTISVNRKSANETQETEAESPQVNQYKLKEFDFNQFSKSFTLPKEINFEGINAKYEAGVLSLILPKKEVFNKSIEIA